MVKVYIDPGHGGKDPGAVGNGLKEKDLTLKIAKKIEAMLAGYNGVEVRLSRNSDIDVSLKQRTDDANKWKADLLVSVHINAGGGAGYEDFIFDGVVGDFTIKAQKTLHDEIVKQIPQYKNRGKKRKNLHMCRESRMAAVLTETGFIDNAADAMVLKSEAFLDRVALGHVNGIVKLFGLSKKNNDHLFRLKTGTFTNKAAAEKTKEFAYV